ncbi:adenylosuccinate synthase [bacterium AH-315-M10]|nr:adenylosuccinate synthase [bacterium AH-315-M10]
MTTRAVIGLQWGDEGKGKLIDLLSAEAEVVVRYQGGANAGHTLVAGEQRFVSHLIPSGILQPGVVCVIGNGVVLDPAELLGEIEQLAQIGIVLDDRLLVSDRAHLVLPYHKLRERLSGGMARIGTTGRGIGPCYTDKVARTGIRVCDLYQPEVLAAAVAVGVESLTHLMEDSGEAPLDVDAIIAEFTEYGERMAPYVTDTFEYLHDCLDQGQSVLLEGAQGTLLDIDFGTYPYVTSSNASACGISSGSGVPLRRMDQIIGILKAYTTRVGEGPFPTELEDDVGRLLREQGAEFGATTGRPRRCGWLDLVAARFAVRLNGIDSIALTKLDVLSGMEQIKVATAYELDGERSTVFPGNVADLERLKPVYETLPGWSEDITGCRKLEDLPPAARDYLAYIEKWLGVPFSQISVGPERSATVTGHIV